MKYKHKKIHLVIEPIDRPDIYRVIENNVEDEGYRKAFYVGSLRRFSPENIKENFELYVSLEDNIKFLETIE